MILALRKFTKLPVLRYLGVYNVLPPLGITYMGVSVPSLRVESTDSPQISPIFKNEASGGSKGAGHETKINQMCIQVAII